MTNHVRPNRRAVVLDLSTPLRVLQTEDADDDPSTPLGIALARNSARIDRLAQEHAGTSRLVRGARLPPMADNTDALAVIISRTDNGAEELDMLGTTMSITGDTDSATVLITFRCPADLRTFRLLNSFWSATRRVSTVSRRLEAMPKTWSNDSASQERVINARSVPAGTAELVELVDTIRELVTDGREVACGTSSLK